MWKLHGNNQENIIFGYTILGTAIKSIGLQERVRFVLISLTSKVIKINVALTFLF